MKDVFYNFLEKFEYLNKTDPMERTKIVLPAYRLLIRLISKVNYLIKKLIYVKPAKPYNLIYVDPFEIKKAMESTIWVRLRLFYGSGFIKRGEWDFPMQQLQNKHHKLYDCFKEVFINGVNALETEYFRDDGHYKHVKDKEPIAENYVEKYGPMFEMFHEDSFKTPNNFWDLSVEYYPIAIDCDGEFLFLTGKHRLALAKVAGIKKLPVNVAIRHYKWQKFRDQLYTQLKQGDISREDIIEMDHPDLMDLI